MGVSENALRNILWISLFAPYESVNHAGGQTLNYYISRFENNSDFRIRLVTFCRRGEEEKLFNSNRKCKIDVISLPTGIKKLLGNILSINSKFNPYYKYGNGLSRKLAKLLLKTLYSIKKANYNPDIIIMDWTEITLYIEKIKEIFPNSRYVACEHDVIFKRDYINASLESSYIRHLYKNLCAKNTKKIETQALNKCDVAWVQNINEIKVLANAGVLRSKIHFLVPYYHKTTINYLRSNNNILFWGNMLREPNIIAAKWFAKNVMPLLKNLDCKFYILGANGDKTLQDIASDKIIPVGFISSVDKWFSSAMCFVAPMSLGAGIKVKCLEAMYSGIPVLTNARGINGIPAKDGIDYIKCEKAEDYANAIKKLIRHEIYVSGKNAIAKNFNLEQSFENYKHILMSFCLAT